VCALASMRRAISAANLQCDLQHTATHCNTLQHTATHCNTLQHTTTPCNYRYASEHVKGNFRGKRKHRRIRPQKAPSRPRIGKGKQQFSNFCSKATLYSKSKSELTFENFFTIAMFVLQKLRICKRRNSQNSSLRPLYIVNLKVSWILRIHFQTSPSLHSF